jgi:uncharacterized membrane protein YeaQ/YmgE (transglycosylase-associated protein family)
MNLVMGVLVGLLAGVLAGGDMTRGGYGLRGDILLGLAGSLVGSWIFGALRVSPEGGMLVVAVVGFVGATILIVSQRQIWPAIA